MSTGKINQEELINEGIARELVSKVQNLRKTKDFDVADRIKLYYYGNIKNVITSFEDYIKKETLTEELLLQKEVIEFLRCASSSFFTAERYEWLRKKVIKDGSRRKYKKSDVLAFVERLQKSA